MKSGWSWPIVDNVDPATRSRIMSRIRGKDTTPELSLRRALFGLGVRYRVHNRRVPGTPDISHTKTRVAVFVDGCFWHGCPQHYSTPASRQEYWAGRLAYNKDLRQRVKARLLAGNWEALEFWECEVKRDADEAAARISQAIQRRRLATL